MPPTETPTCVAIHVGCYVNMSIVLYTNLSRLVEVCNLHLMEARGAQDMQGEDVQQKRRAGGLGVCL
jgi:hypothetical protein